MRRREFIKSATATGMLAVSSFSFSPVSGSPDECLKFVLDQDYVDCFTIGVENLDQLKDLEKRVPKVSRRG